MLDYPETLRAKLAEGALDLPLPGSGATRRRWSELARLGRTDLPLARVAEGHCDAVAILAEADRKSVPGALYGVWAARSGGTGAVLRGDRLTGTVRFCSGAHGIDRALVVALDEQRRSVLVEVDLREDRVRPVEGTWQALGMADSDSPDVVLDEVPVHADQIVGEPGFYLERPGFWLGGGGVAAVWLGGAAGVVDSVLAGLRAPDEHQLAHLGALHTALRSTQALLDQAAEIVDDDPRGDHRVLVWTCRAAAERAAWEVLDRVPRITGPTPLCRDAGFAQRLADLQVYVRQHHAERDLAALGGAVVRGEDRRVLPVFDPTGYRRVTAVAAHPDDETLGAGGVLRQLHELGASIRLVVASDGEAAFPELEAEDRAELGRRRRRELAEALAELGVHDAEVHWLGLPDSGLAHHEAELTERLRELLADADCCLLPWPGDPHPDHRAVAGAALAAAPVTAHRWSYPIWMWHWMSTTDPAIPWQRAHRVPLTDPVRQGKSAALRAFDSQLVRGPNGEPPILPPEVLAHFERDEEVLFREPRRESAPLARFSALYAADPDPWRTATSPYEQRKRALVLAALPRQHYEFAVEPACGAGALTRELAARCTRVDAFDPVAEAVAAARRHSGVAVRQATLPEGFGPERADLVVLSEILYYLSDDELDRTLDAVTEVLEPGGDLLLVHWRPWAPEAVRDGAAAHERVAARPGLVKVVSHVDDQFLLDVLRRR
ncbi:PIG-L family deacetylase [Kutzneria albida]|uniref:LmbE family protein n=1 Tax=Kutzneria albida DSM 43870 TaxID=1449976 RepID=W5W9Y7_9PSEU|nr:PIG-L family deacetylase [Kutzneria albida]AHH97943.1 hypothetical protein KALB_4581 [Kutzneria albida DSM 43870]